MLPRRTLRDAAHFDWIPLDGNLVEATKCLIEKHNPAWTLGGMDTLHGRYLRAIAEAGFRNIETFSYDLDVCCTHAGWRGRVRASAGVATTLRRSEVAAFDGELARLLKRSFPEDPLRVLHRIWVMQAGKA